MIKVKKKFIKAISLLTTVGLFFSHFYVTKVQAAEDEVHTPNVVFEDNGGVSGKKSAEWVSDGTAKVTLEVTAGKKIKEEEIINKTDVILIIDTSSSMIQIAPEQYVGDAEETPETKLAKVKVAAKEFISNLLPEYNDRVRVGVISFNDDAYNMIDGNMTNDVSVIDSQIDSIRSGKELGTNLEAALTMADGIVNQNLSEGNAKQLVIVLSDGEPTYSYEAAGYDTQTGWLKCGTATKLGYGGEYKMTVTVGNRKRYVSYRVTYLDDEGKEQDYTYVDEHGNTQSVRVENHGQTTIARAKWMALDPCSIYAIGYGIEGNAAAESVMRQIASDSNLYRSADVDSNPYPSLNEVADIVGTQHTRTYNCANAAVVTDQIPEHFTLDEAQLPENVSYDASNRTVTWTLGDMEVPEDQESITKSISLSMVYDKEMTDCIETTEAGSFVNTNTYCNLDYVDENGVAQKITTTRTVNGTSVAGNPWLPVVIEPTDIPTVTPTPEPTDIPTVTPIPEPTDIPTATPTPEPTDIPTATPTPEPTDIPTAIPTPEPTDTPTPTPDPVASPTPDPVVSPTPDPVDTPTPEPIDTPTPDPMAQTIYFRDEEPTNAPVVSTVTPTITPTVMPTETPTEVPTEAPTLTPTEIPEEDIVNDEIPEGSVDVKPEDETTTDSSKDIGDEPEDIVDDEVPLGTTNPGSLPKTGTLPVELFYGLGSLCIVMGGCIVRGKKKK